MDNTKIESLLNQVAEIGKEAYKPEYQDKISKWRKIGLAISHITDDPKGVIEMAFAFLEDWNYHDVCSVLDWMFPYEGKIWDSNLIGLKKRIDKKSVEISIWNKDHSEIITKHAKVTVNVKWLD